MSSNPIEAPTFPGLAARAGLGPRPSDARLLKRLLPKTLFGRSILIIVTPLILLQLIVTWVL